MNYNPFSLINKTILVSGASSGIGKAIAIECSKIGATVILTARNTERLNETLAEMEGTNHKIITADLNQKEDIDRIINCVPNIQGLVNCAGLTINIPFQFATREKIESVMNVNFYASSEITRQLIKTKKIGNGASIVFISSISGILCSAVTGSIYSASKGAINGLVKGMALDLAPKNIRVNCVNPGMVHTNIFSEGVITEEQLQEDIKKYPLKRYGKPEEVAYAVIYLLSDASTWTTGSNIIIDGGYTLQ